MSRSFSHQLTTTLAALGMIVLFSPLVMSAVVALAGSAA
jgi:hypothetical protein